jgi:predicted NBD/HSP70 family sugar kinase
VQDAAPESPVVADERQAPINLASLGRVRVLRALNETPALSRAELVERTGLARATVGSVVDDLIDAGLVRKSTDLDAGVVRRSTDPRRAADTRRAVDTRNGVDPRRTADTGPAARTGRPPQLLSLEPRAAYAVGLDIGHDHVRAVLTDLVGSVLWDTSAPLDVDGAPESALSTAVTLLDRAVDEVDVERERILGLGLGIACPVDKTTGALHAEGIMPGWVGVQPARELGRRTELEVRIINDANAGVLAERRFGVARDCANVVYIRLSSGIGAGVMCDGRMLLGHGGLAGELGHVTVEPNGAVCRCGNRGCLETVASPPAIAALLARSWGRPVNAEELTDLLRTGDRGTLRAVEDAGDAVGRALAFTVMLLNPELIVVGGDLAAAGEALFEPMRRSLMRSTMTSHAEPLRIVPGSLGDDAGVRGAAALVLATAPERLGQAPLAAA